MKGRCVNCGREDVEVVEVDIDEWGNSIYYCRECERKVYGSKEK